MSRLTHAAGFTERSFMESPHVRQTLSTLIDELKHRGGLEGSLGESPASLLAYMEELDRRTPSLDDRDRERKA